MLLCLFQSDDVFLIQLPAAASLNEWKSNWEIFYAKFSIFRSVCQQNCDSRVLSDIDVGFQWKHSKSRRVAERENAINFERNMFFVRNEKIIKIFFDARKYRTDEREKIFFRERIVRVCRWERSHVGRTSLCAVKQESEDEDKNNSDDYVSWGLLSANETSTSNTTQ